MRNEGGECYPSVGYCSECSRIAVAAGLDACMNTSKSKEEQQHVEILAPIDAQLAAISETSGDVAITPEPEPIAFPPGIPARPTPSPMPKPTSNPNPNISVGSTSNRNTSLSEQTPFPDEDEEGLVGREVEEEEETSDCVDSVWVIGNGHAKGVLKWSEFARVLCIPGAELPCGTPGHLLHKCDDGKCTLVSYSETCARMGGCTERFAKVARLRSRYP